MFPELKNKKQFLFILLFILTSFLFSETIHTEINENFNISLAGEGWIYMGEKQGREGVILQSRSFEPGFTVMEFLCSNEGYYTLIFEYQDFISGENRIESRDVMTGGSEKKSDTVSEDPISIKPAEIVEFEVISGKSLLDDCRFYSESKNYEKCTELLKAYIKNDFVLHEDFFKLLIKLDPGTVAESIIPAIDFKILKTQVFSEEFFTELKDFVILADRADVLEPMLLNRLNGASSAEKANAAWQLGEFYHYTAGSADLELASHYYNMIYTKHPYSEFWAPSRDRLDSMNQHYFQIR